MRDYLYSILSPFKEGSTFRGYCPSCGGRDSFTAWVSGQAIIYNCYRAGCDVLEEPPYGRFNLKLSPEEKIAYLKRKRIEEAKAPFEAPDYWIEGLGSPECVSYMTKNNMMDVFKAGNFRPMYDPAERRFVFPIREGSKVVGGIGRSLIGAYPKTYNYNESYTKPFICGTGDIALLVEDCASAVAAARCDKVTGVALLGTNIRQDFILSLTNFKWVGIALDPDAYKWELRKKVQLSPYIKDIRVLKLSKDIKDLDNISYESFIYGNSILSI